MNDFFEGRKRNAKRNIKAGSRCFFRKDCQPRMTSFAVWETEHDAPQREEAFYSYRCLKGREVVVGSDPDAEGYVWVANATSKDDCGEYRIHIADLVDPSERW